MGVAKLLKLACLSVLANGALGKNHGQRTGPASMVVAVPNGDRVDCPPTVEGCHHYRAKVYCQTVLHTSCERGSSKQLNAFGLAYSLAGYRWTKELCEADSDGDGATNGEELGDPCCEWEDHTSNPLASQVSHPGFAHSKPEGLYKRKEDCAVTEDDVAIEIAKDSLKRAEAKRALDEGSRKRTIHRKLLAEEEEEEEEEEKEEEESEEESEEAEAEEEEEEEDTEAEAEEEGAAEGGDEGASGEGGDFMVE
mmetsp:Transcript_42135/g.51161  ORF Transcript_42135/g.51161 Transcript_42135/m.51161 type:complete len:252 (+) Transcript_42135:98-853(+)|eukprot:CAMPEP_0197850900 /NCGR_PEP_ID=MMETSP1438-20131217/16697_1 /TAXON_ID=1461541 /ORGANISM="Pterosperma sp., Strain CCMP1384" /LENGTH=251 /DNA_ID=CAMNT_0043464297 /DNA_START=78 /DNA_END=833 /DNA_ORIENTATION=+